MVFIRVGKDKAELLSADGSTVMATKERGMTEVLDSGFLNVEVRYHNKFEQIMVIERPPAVNAVSGQGEMLDIPVPWQVYVVDYANGIVRLYFRKSPLKSLDDEVFLCYLDHVKPDGSSCTDFNHQGNVRDLLEQIKQDTFKGVIDLINDSIWGGRVRGASYMKWYADIPKEIKAEDTADYVSKTLDTKFDVQRIMEEVTLLSYGDNFPTRHDRWADWFGEPLTLQMAIDKTKEHRRVVPSIRNVFEHYV